ALKRLEGTTSFQPELYAAHARFLIRQREFEAAEAFLMRMSWVMPAESAKLVFELHQSWGRLASIEQELAKFRLPGAVRKEVLFLTRQAVSSPTPQP
ncbi:MAG: hypothetical protein Q8M07_08760, partial [Prosthecobacter sp.]|nr:hypothetical protein [Prosthecobacter sp.]